MMRVVVRRPCLPELRPWVSAVWWCPDAGTAESVLKRYARLARFERALRVLRAADAPSLSLAAAQLGFADQPHLTREFRYFAGIAPGRLHRVPGPTPWHVVHDETFKTGRPDPGTLPS